MSEGCLFCRIVAGKIPATKVLEEDRVVAFEDVNPQAPTHLLVIPREHIPRALDLEPKHASLVGELFLAAGKLARERGLEEGFRLVMNNGVGAGQSVFHIHLHVLGGRPMTWPPG